MEKPVKKYPLYPMLDWFEVSNYMLEKYGKRPYYSFECNNGDVGFMYLNEEDIEDRSSEEKIWIERISTEFADCICEDDDAELKYLEFYVYW